MDDQTPVEGDSELEQIPLRTPLQFFLLVVMALSGGLTCANAFLWFQGEDLLPGWLGNDAMIAFIVTGLCYAFINSHFVIDPRAKVLRYVYSNPVYYDKREIPFSEFAALAVKGTTGGWPLLLHTYWVQMQQVLIYKNGAELSISEGQNLGANPLEDVSDFTRDARDLARKLGCGFFPTTVLSLESLEKFRAEIRPLLEASDRPAALEQTLWNAAVSELTFDLVAPGRIKVEMSTFLEKVILFFLSVLFVVSTIYILMTESTLIRNNPRVLYLILLDSSSVLVTLFGLWRWLIDEYYVVDLDEKAIFFSSRILFWSGLTRLGSFKEIRYITLEEVSRDFQFQVRSAPEVRVVAVFRDQTELVLSDPIPSLELARLKARNLARLIDCPARLAD